MDILCNNIDCYGIGMRRADWDNFRECQDIVLNGEVIWENAVLSQAVKSRIYEDIVTTGHHSSSLALEVWRAANAYCRAHKLAHPELTEQGKLLSNFVNADPDLYCSLPLTATPEALSAMPTRGAYNNGTGYFRTGITVTNENTTVKIKFARVGDLQTTAFRSVFGASTGSRYLELTNYKYNSAYGSVVYGNGSSETYCIYGGGYNKNVYYDETITQINNVIGLKRELNGELIYERTKANNNRNQTSAEYLILNGTLGINDGKIALCDIERGTSAHKYFIPSKISNTMELLDLETLTLATRVGTFTEQKDIPIS